MAFSNPVAGMVSEDYNYLDEEIYDVDMLGLNNGSMNDLSWSIDPQFHPIGPSSALDSEMVSRRDNVPSGDGRSDEGRQISKSIPCLDA